ncbi:MAG: glycosyltransferase, partial [Pleurocapsa sp.]
HLDLPITFIGTGVSNSNWDGVKDYQLLDLPPDRLEYVPDLPINQDCQTYSFHYAPYYSNAYRQRAVILANWVAQTNATAVVVDVSAEITQYLRFLGVPVIAVRQHGDRSDYPHIAGYDAAYRTLAPYPEILECGDIPSWIREKTIYCPGFSRYSERVLSKADARAQLNISSQQQVAEVFNCKGGAKHSLSTVVQAALSTPQWLWLIVGQTDRDCQIVPDNVSVTGWCEDTYPYLKAADLAIASGGHNTVMEIGTARIPFLCIPESRPFKEQQIKAQKLQNLGLCEVRQAFPTIDSLEFVFSRLQEIDVGRWDEIMAADGALQAAETIYSEIALLASYLEKSDLKQQTIAQRSFFHK